MSLDREPTTSTIASEHVTPNRPCTLSKSLKSTNGDLSKLLIKLPQEILCEIFSWCCPTFDDRFSSPPDVRTQIESCLPAVAKGYIQRPTALDIYEPQCTAP